MHRFDAFDNRSLVLLAVLLLLMTSMGLIWLQYETELDRIKETTNEVKSKYEPGHEKIIYPHRKQSWSCRT
jgi:hypothetical protein